jgi:cation diffusion facilitator family transporter
VLKTASQLKIRAMQKVLLGGFLIMGIKLAAYFLTHSNAVLTDALESIINIITGVFALFSLYYASQPKDEDHPYGHGKIELLSAGFEGGLIFISGVLIIAKSIFGFFQPASIHSLDTAALLSLLAGAANFVMGKYLISLGKKHHSMIMTADGKHLISDTISSIGLVIGLLVIHFTKLLWLDNLIAILFGGFIFYTGYKLLKQSITGLLDEADYENLEKLIKVLNENRSKKWIDMHNLRVLKYGHTLHIDAHITLPWYDNLENTHHEVIAVENLIKDKIHEDIEFFIHSDPCIPGSCAICSITECKVRSEKFEQKLDWTLKNLLPNRKHSISD